MFCAFFFLLLHIYVPYTFPDLFGIYNMCLEKWPPLISSERGYISFLSLYLLLGQNIRKSAHKRWGKEEERQLDVVRQVFLA